ncbi:MAG: pyridoxal phosphate-dependent aminotransferase [Actinobacteria bacterium]|jgi:aspartate/methionine/tyrosine aminotransferase|nr:pyridoxal phosphate-dependent aminotransferase [Actinomycetota bacterium]MBT3745420.1 pyridoxal phosphate-dependent aminotransferase [Actinomycetota bacterium]MBT3969224.1 pyridoxal phosphate-dependent aminotransferase [Actinomycetota bacterium]MBT4009254.1 pyridoxal phosphate-dependent aminotransferase [Actinomycetota bacterium]MBT4303704.1 pyridoxal phosphate-dependent aminotransferase [Actinomycetota bacterium]
MTSNRLSQRIGAIAESATMAVDKKAKALKAAGEPVIGFGAGEPDFATPPHIVEAAVEACLNPASHKYTPAGGLPVLKEALVEKTERDSGWRPTASQFLITNGGKHAVYNSCAVLLDPGDEVLLPAPYWTTYPESIALAGGVAVPLLTDMAAGFKVTVDQLEAARTERTKALMFVSPSNPTGAVYSLEEIQAIGRWCVEHGIWVIADEIYEHLTYDGHEHHSIRAAVPELADTCLIVNGVAKTYAMTGWRVGWMIGPEDAIKAATNLQSHATSNVANVSQYATLAAVSGDLSAVAEMRSAFDRRRVVMTQMLQAIDGVEMLVPQGAFYAYPDLSAFLGREIAGRVANSTSELAAIILDVAQVAIVPGEAFGTPGYARLSFALGDDDLVEGVSRIADLLGG